MLQQRWLYVAVATVACILQAQGADKYTDENRPYEFGFNIDGEQHRHEKKDENGLIMGEFGFLTADGVYHVTVYATDENGNFKILSMKNIRTKPYPTAPERKGHSLPLPASKNPPQTQGPVPQKPSSSVPALPPAAPARSCSHCSLPMTTTRTPQLTDLAVVSQDQGNNQFGGQGPQGGDKYPGGQQNNPGPGPQYPATGSDPNYPQGPGAGGQPNYSQGEGGIPSPGRSLQTPLGNNPGDRNPKQFTDYPNGPGGNSGPDEPNKPTLISAQMQIVDKNTDIHHKNPGERDGLPDGLTKDDMVRLLYTFNYTVGFHGHYEEGYTNGNKQGYYFVTGRNGVKTRVDYVADEKGFRPKISQEVLDLLSDDVPKPETEKDEKFGLKGYEFKWLYYPADSSRR